VKGMTQGPPLLDAKTDCGAIPMGPKQLAHYQALVDDAVRPRERPAEFRGGIKGGRGERE
jgi:hypothetical protein